MDASWISAGGTLAVFVGKSGGAAGFDYFSLLLWTLFFVAWIGVGGAVLFGVLALVGQFRPTRYDDLNNEQDEPGTLLLLTVVGSLAALGVTLWLCNGPFLKPGLAGVQQAVKYVLAAAAAGEVAMWIAWRLQEDMPRVTRGRLSWNAALGWVFLPCVMILARAGLALALVAMMLVTGMVVICLRRELPARDEDAERDERVLRYLYGTPAIRSGRTGTLLAAVFAQLALVCAVAGRMVTACVLLAGAVSVMVWRWSASYRQKKKPKEWILWVRLVLAMVVAFVMTVMMQVALPKLGVFMNTTPKIAEVDKSKTSYFSVVLLPSEKKKEVAIAKVAPAAADLTRGRLAKPVVIPFNGPYWYFEPPILRPGKEAKVMHGKSTEQNARTVDGEMLLMEAHQALKQPIDLSSCGEIDLALTNAETRPGRITVGVMLRDSVANARQILMLQQQPLVSSEEEHVDPKRGPVDETLRFMVTPENGVKLRRFDEITVIFLPQGRMGTGSKVAVREFRLMPR